MIWHPKGPTEEATTTKSSPRSLGERIPPGPSPPIRTHSPIAAWADVVVVVVVGVADIGVGDDGYVQTVVSTGHPSDYRAHGSSDAT